MNRWLSHIASPFGVLASFGALVAAWWLWRTGSTVDGRLVRFVGVLLAMSAVMCWLRIWAHAARRGGHPWGRAAGWRVTPLPFFDEECRGSFAGARRVLVASGLMAVGVAGIGIAAVVAASSPHTVGFVDLAPGERTEAWQQTLPVLAPRALGMRLDVTGFTPDAGLEVTASNVGETWSRTAVLRPNVPVAMADQRLTWRGVSVDQHVGGAQIRVRVGNVEETATVDLGETVSLDNGATLTAVSGLQNRLDALGPAIRVRIEHDGGEELAWLHARAPELHANMSDGEVGLALEELLPRRRARLVISSALPADAQYVAIVSAVVLAFGTAMLLLWPIWRRGRSGDYELVALGPTGPRRVSAAASQILSPDALAEWRTTFAQESHES